MDLDELEYFLAGTLRALRVGFKKIVLVRGVSFQFVIDDFGLIVNGISSVDYSIVRSAMLKHFPNWRDVYISTSDNVIEKKYVILWELMRCGYMKWLRLTYPHQVNNVLFGHENLAQRIILERLRIWGNSPRFKFLIEDNKAALRGDLRREVSFDPSFFDYMPEECVIDGGINV